MPKYKGDIEKYKHSRRRRMSRSILLPEFWYIVDNSIPIFPKLIRKEFDTEDQAKYFLKQMFLSTFIYDIITGPYAIECELRFYRPGRQNLPTIRKKDYEIPYSMSWQEKKNMRKRLRRKIRKGLSQSKRVPNEF